jgi:5-oxoprolinase (ATP-hydrolysing)
MGIFFSCSLKGGNPGTAGLNLLVRNTPTGPRLVNFGGKNATIVNKGDRIRIETPGGGGYGAVGALKRKQSDKPEMIIKKAGGSLQNYIDAQHSV